MRENLPRAASVTDESDAGISLASVVVMLVTLGVLVVGIYWGLPAYFGSSVIEVTIRN